MGAWSGRPFGNDEAGDFLYDYREVSRDERADFLRGVFDAVTQEVPMPADAGERGVAGAAIVVQSLGTVDSGLGDADLLDAGVARGLAPLAARVLDLVLAEDSELKELWDDSGETEWIEAMTRLREAV